MICQILAFAADLQVDLEQHMLNSFRYTAYLSSFSSGGKSRSFTGDNRFYIIEGDKRISYIKSIILNDFFGLPCAEKCSSNEGTVSSAVTII